MGFPRLAVCFWITTLKSTYTHALISILVGMLIIDRKDLNLEKRLGKGNFGEVWRAKYKGEKDVAVKMTLPNLVNDYEFVAEAKLMM